MAIFSTFFLGNIGPKNVFYDIFHWKSAFLVYKNQAPVVQTLDSAIHRINHHPADKYYGNQLRYPLDSDLSGGYRYPTFEQPGPEVQKVEKLNFFPKGITHGFRRKLAIFPTFFF